MVVALAARRGGLDKLLNLFDGEDAVLADVGPDPGEVVVDELVGLGRERRHRLVRERERGVERPHDRKPMRVKVERRLGWRGLGRVALTLAELRVRRRRRGRARNPGPGGDVEHLGAHTHLESANATTYRIKKNYALLTCKKSLP